jgi:exodeoxyribonuclease V alpha subunit
MTIDEPDQFDPLQSRGAVGILRRFNRAGLLATSDVHVALRLSGLSNSTDEVVQLGVAFAARAPRLGSVCVDLATISATASPDAGTTLEVGELHWPDPSQWVRQLTGSDLVGADRPLHLEGTTLYLDRLWADERLVAEDLLLRASGTAPSVDEDLLAAGLAELFTGAQGPDLQRVAAATAVLRMVSVVAGGPGTGKTTTVARVLALIEAQAAATNGRPPLVALAAPTGKAAARLTESVHEGVEGMPISADQKERLHKLSGTTLHRLLGFDPGNRSRFRHHRLNRLPHDVVVVDETSMVSLSLMARLLEAVRPDARLILVGDPEQLASVEAGAVLGDIVGPALDGVCMRDEARAQISSVSGQTLLAGPSSPKSPIGDGIVVLRQGHRYGGAIETLATAIREGKPDQVIEVLEGGHDDVQWIASDAITHGEQGRAAVRELAVGTGRAVIAAALAGEAPTALEALGRFRLLCAHRRGPEGVTTWTSHIEGWLRGEVEGFTTGSDWYIGRPLIVTENDYALQLFNGDTGVVIDAGNGRMAAAFDRGAGSIVEVSPARMAAVDSVYAMTVHRSQGSQFDVVAFMLPSADSRVLTRELLYTAVTRARERLIVVGTADAIRTAVERPIARASGLRQALWGSTS